MQKYVDGEWVTTFPANAYTQCDEIIVFIESGETTGYFIPFISIETDETLKNPLESGQYKFIHYFSTEDSKISVECEFVVA